MSDDTPSRQLFRLIWPGALVAQAILGWRLASRVGDGGRLSLHIGSPATVAERLEDKEHPGGQRAPG